MTPIEAKVLLTMCELFTRAPDEIGLETNLYEDLGIDSLDEVQISMALSELFEIKFTEMEFGKDPESSKIKTIQDLADTAERLCTIAGKINAFKEQVAASSIRDDGEMGTN